VHALGLRAGKSIPLRRRSARSGGSQDGETGLHILGKPAGMARWVTGAVNPGRAHHEA